MSVPETNGEKKYPITMTRLLGLSSYGLQEGSPFLRQVVGAVVGLEVDPSSSSQVQSVQVCAVDVTRCPSKHVEEAIYDDHRLRKHMEGKALKEPVNGAISMDTNSNSDNPG